VHPVCPVLANDGLYVFVGNESPKVHDLRRDPRALTSDGTLFEFFIERAMHAKHGARPSWPPTYTKWSPAV